MEFEIGGAQLAQLQVELQRMNAENHKLRDMLSHVSNNYSSLHMHLLSLMQQKQQQQNHPSEPAHQREVHNNSNSYPNFVSINNISN